MATELDFDVSIDDTYRADNFQTLTRANGNDDKPKKSAPRRAANTLFYFCCGCLCLLLVITGIIALIVALSSQNVRACCTEGMCINATKNECKDVNGTFQHDISSCAVATCPTLAPTPSPPLPVVVTTEVPPFVNSATIDPLVSLQFLCNVPFNNGTCRAIFSYTNTLVAALDVPVGVNNYVGPGPANRHQRTHFKSGTHTGGATFLWNCVSHLHAQWTLRTGGGVSVASAPRSLVACPSLNSINN